MSSSSSYPGIEISPKGTYLVTVSEDDNSFIGWNVENVEDKDEVQLKPDYHYTNQDHIYGLNIHAFLQNYEDNSGEIDSAHFVVENDSIKWEIRRLNYCSNLELQAFKKKDLRNNKMFLSVITSTIPLYYPEYILKYSLETSMIIDSYNIKHQRLFLFYPFYVLYLILLKCHFVNGFRSEDYNWLLELFKPQSSPFVKMVNEDIYKTWNGEALINFKWNAYGKYYYTTIWISFIALLGCFTAVATIPQQHINEDTQKQLLIASIILGFIHLSFEI
ncbi:hypothetical protein C1645_834064 [Glomus cerebriforme]|uniref:Uncharacterized protein n=1 Tax=Glomus cerebriforme TaxID=658196 RepID=A0A397SCQ4_9GLOM|nr:hypothetical protein C1645_834064 [Glomus cerebriforme]